MQSSNHVIHFVFFQKVLIFLTLSLFGISSASAVQLPGPLVDTAWLKKHREEVVVLDVRKDVKSFEKRARDAGPVNPCGVARRKAKEAISVAGHIPGAVLVPWKDVISKRKMDGKEIYVMVPDKSQFERLMQKSGVNKDSVVVITGKGETVAHTALAARLYWTLKYFGHNNVALLNGGTAQWIRYRHKVKFGRSRAKRGDFTASAERSEILATMYDVMNLGESESVQLMDVRGRDVYLGLTHNKLFVSRDSKGHIPGAGNFPTSFMADSMGPASIYSADKVKTAADLLDVDVTKPTVTSCDTGVMASLGWFVLHELLGNNQVRLYDGSMHEWSRAGNPVMSMMAE
ncbi:MAG: hypothetical protein KZQ90_00015 [Candidatus Thiodiazotropha sp. (ex Codakia rugifera)]|nr:hypothetical protein [Candidatus Thiodiazotropha sp. (ex Codakia rugifera)]